jgi:hypothetical protein
LVYRFDDETGWNFTDLGYGQFTTPISLGTTYTLSLGWDGRQITFKLNDEVATYIPVGTIDPPNRHWKGISTLVYQPNGSEAIIEALFDDVMVSAASCPDITVDPQLIDFGIVSPGGSTPDQTVTVKNAGSMNLTLGAIGTPSAPFSLTGGSCMSNQAVTPQGSCTLTIRFAPTVPGVFTSNFSIPSDDPVDPSVTVNLAGEVPSISVTPTTYNFTNVKVKRRKTVSFVVKNAGKATLSILTSTITGLDASMFTITSGVGSKTIKPGKSLTIKVAFKPTSQGSKSATLEIIANDPVTPTVEIPLTGIGR